MGDLRKNLNFLKENGFNVAPFGFAKNEGEAIQIAEEIGYPVVFKIPSDIHKTEVGGVLLNIHNVPDLKKLGRKFVSKLEEKGIVFDGLIVQKQVSGVEIIAGIKNDPVFGKVVMLGVGGIFAELYKDVSFRVCPIDENDAEDMINETKVKELLSFRGMKINKANLKNFLVKLSKLDVKEMDLNPVILNNDGYWIVDARIME